MKISQFPEDVIDSNVNYTLKEIKNVIKKYGPRESASEACYNAQKHMAKELDQFSDEVHFEEFKTAPHAFLHFTKITAAAIFIAAIAGFVVGFVTGNWFISNILIFAVTFLGLFATVMEFLLYKEFFDPLYKQHTGRNLVATRKPTGEVKRRIVVSGHCDSAYEWFWIYKTGAVGFKIGLFGAIGFSILACIFSLVSIILYATGSESPFIQYSFYLNFAEIIFMIPLYTFSNFNRVVPGANDNLTGTYGAICTLRMLEEAGVNLENTEVVALVTDGEECGLRGARAWAKAHKDEIQNSGVETIFVGADTLTDLKDMCVYNRDMTGLVQHDKGVSRLVKEAGADAGVEMEYSSVYFGASDAAAVTQQGLKATCIAAMDPAPARYYHTRTDSYDILQPEAIKAGYKVMLSSVLKFDEEGLKE